MRIFGSVIIHFVATGPTTVRNVPNRLDVRGNSQMHACTIRPRFVSYWSFLLTANYGRKEKNEETLNILRDVHPAHRRYQIFNNFSCMRERYISAERKVTSYREKTAFVSL